MEVPAAAAAATTGAAGLWLFDYNRENYQYDQAMRFARFMSSRSFANSQMGQYREDVHGLTAMTVGKMDTWQTVATLFLCVCAALSCAGRLGMHGAAPPGWFCALYSGNIFTAIMFNGLALWLALHASLRAQCAMTSLLTRKVRLPIPSLAQMDQARNFGSAFEYQRMNDIFRVPFMRHPEQAPELPSGSGDGDAVPAGKKVAPPSGKQADGKKDAKTPVPDPYTSFASTTRDTVPSWIRDEQVIDKGGGIPASVLPGSGVDPDDVPEHFKLLAKAMDEWYQYDIYARVSMLYGVMCFLFAVTYYAVGTAMSELRGFWIAWSVGILFMTAQALILRLDILQSVAKSQKMLPHAEWLGHTAPYLAIMACTLEFRWWYSPVSVVITWILVILAFFGHFMMALRMLDLAWPDWSRTSEMSEEPGKQWWPMSWKVPSAFAKALWVLAPPKKLEPGQHCLMKEMEALSKGGGGISTCRRRKKGTAGKPTTLRRRGTKRGATPRALDAQVNRIDRLFQWWFDESVWAQVPERGQLKLHELYNQYQPARQMVDTLIDGRTEAAAASSGSEGSPRIARMEYDGNGFGERTPYFYERATGNMKWNLDPQDQRRTTSIQDIEERIVNLADTLADIDDALTDVESTSKVPGTPGENLPPRNSGGASEGAYTGSSPFKAFGMKRAHDLPWQLTRVAIITVAVQWFYMMIASAVEMSLGTESLLKPPGEPPWIRDIKYRNWKPEMVHVSTDSLPSNYRLFAASTAHYEEGHHSASDSSHGSAHGGHGGHHRRLSEANRSAEVSAALGDLLKVLPSVGWLADTVADNRPVDAQITDWPRQALPDPGPVVAPPGFMAPGLKTENVAWPPFFEPQHLLCAPTAGERAVVAALSSRGFGALARLMGGEGEDKTGRQVVDAEPFALEGVSEHGPIAGAAWTGSGLQLVTKAGHLLQCSGKAPTDEGTWPCKAAEGTPLPLPESARLAAAAVTELADSAGRLIALVFEHLPGSVALFKDDGENHAWNPAGEFHLPPQSGTGGSVGLAFAKEELLIVTGSGDIHRRHIRDGTSALNPAPVSATPREFPGACALPTGSLVRLALRRSGVDAGSSWGPELIPAA